MERTKQKKNLETLLAEPEVEAWRSLIFGFRRLYKNFEEELLKEGCSYARLQLLFFLYFEGAHAPVTLAQKLLVTRANISTFLKRMSQDGLIKESSKNGASQKRPHYRLTKKGEKVFEEIFPKHIDRVKKSIPPLSEKHLNFLDKVRLTNE